MAILEDALRCFQNNCDAKIGSRKRLFQEAEQWLCGEGGEGPFSFEMVCETLGIEPSFLRNGLREWRRQQLEGNLVASAGAAFTGGSHRPHQRAVAARGKRAAAGQ